MYNIYLIYHLSCNLSKYNFMLNLFDSVKLLNILVFSNLKLDMVVKKGLEVGG